MVWCRCWSSAFGLECGACSDYSEGLGTIGPKVGEGGLTAAIEAT